MLHVFLDPALRAKPVAVRPPSCRQRAAPCGRLQRDRRVLFGRQSLQRQKSDGTGNSWQHETHEVIEAGARENLSGRPGVPLVCPAKSLEVLGTLSFVDDGRWIPETN